MWTNETPACSIFDPGRHDFSHVNRDNSRTVKDFLTKFFLKFTLFHALSPVCWTKRRLKIRNTLNLSSNVSRTSIFSQFLNIKIHNFWTDGDFSKNFFAKCYPVSALQKRSTAWLWEIKNVTLRSEKLSSGRASLIFSVFRASPAEIFENRYFFAQNFIFRLGSTIIAVYWVFHRTFCSLTPL